jgi:radical SAM protein with 4Fe4S-binding SPASM domain
MKVLGIELTNKCNARCKFCINSKFAKYGDMSDEILDKVLTDAQEFDLETICINNIGESFLCENIIKKIKRIRDTFPNTLIRVFSNGSFLTDEILEQLKELKVSLNISLNSSSPDGRKERMGLNDFDKVKKMIDKGIEIGAITNVTFVDLYPLEQNLKVFSSEKERFLKFYPQPLGQIIPYANFAGDTYTTQKPKKYCNRAIRELVILFDGTVTLCCMSALKTDFGNVKDKTLKEIWTSKQRQDYKLFAEKGEPFGVCLDCTGA